MKGTRSLGRRALARADALLNRLYGWRYNPIYHSGALVVALMVLLLITGIYLLLFYRIGSPYASVARLTSQAWVGRWIRGVHRFASDAAVVAAAFHALRLFIQKRSWGPRTLAWVSGLILLFVVFVCGWTGYVMVWDIQGEVLAREGARLLDLIPIFSEPISRGFVGERPLPAAFFFLNLFLHIALPIGLGILLWIHVSRVARPGLLPPRPLYRATVVILVALAVLWPVTMDAPADLFRTAGPAGYDMFFAFWVPLARKAPAWVTWALWGTAGLALFFVPLWSRPRKESRPAPSFVDEKLCTGCEQCFVDCPYEAISMISRTDDRPTLVAHVDPSLCVSCGICAGSCAPMGVGPPGRTGRDQLAQVREFVERHVPGPGDIVVAGCTRSAAAAFGPGTGILAWPVNCAGNLHTSVIEYLLRAGAGGVLVVSCPPRDCWNREGPKWLEQRIYHDREAELQERVDRRRVRVAYVAEADATALQSELERFRAELDALERSEREAAIDVERECDVVEQAGHG